MDFELSREHKALRRLVREFAEEAIRPIVKRADRASQPPLEVIKKAAEIGLLGVPFPREYGGLGAGEIGYCVLMEELGRVDTSVATIIGAHIGIGTMAIYLSGNRQLKEKYLPDLCAGKRIAAFALTEPQAGSDAASIRLRATREGNSYMLDGSKMWITNGPIADVMSVLAVTDPALGARGGATAFVVETAWDGFSAGKYEHKMGLHGSPTSAISFDNFRVPQENVLGQVGLGFVVFMQTLDIGRVSLGAATLGGAQAALQACLEWAKLREQFGRSIAQMQSVQFMIADMAAEIEALRSLVYRTAWLVDNGKPFIKEAGMCKLLGSEIGSRCVDRAVQIHGALGYSRDFDIERGFRDARIAEIFEGTNEIQRILIAEQLFREVGVRIRP
ncbi:MAG TPA: acyl-CoA dehydrogenase family protein [Anaerolineae bacterium]|nr:acyl-CoA dehydrogenase family protein [Anaerolineae bacterium]